jgi:hypothetical protein
MFKIDGAGTLVDKPARTALGVVPGWFNQTPGTSPGTVVTAEWLNMLQAEVLAVLASATVVPDKADDSQLLAALQKLIKQSQPTGMRAGFIGTVAPAGWVMASGRTIGSAASGATERANADTQDLFNLIWPLPVDEFPIQTSAGAASVRGASAAADWAANKRMVLPNYSDRIAVGRGDMSGAPAGLITIAATGLDTTKIGAKAGLAARAFHFEGTTGPSNGGTFNAGASGIDVANNPHAHDYEGDTEVASILNPMIVETVIIRL